MIAHAIQVTHWALATTHRPKAVEQCQRRKHRSNAAESISIANASRTQAETASPKNEPEWQGQWRVLKYL